MNRRGIFHICYIDNKQHTSGSSAVSYTHLDVYKRQHDEISKDSGYSGICDGNVYHICHKSASLQLRYGIADDALLALAALGKEVLRDLREHDVAQHILLAAVSYTHLDVYKRQAPHKALWRKYYVQKVAANTQLNHIFLLEALY